MSSGLQDGMLGLDLISSDCLDSRAMGGVCSVEQSWCPGGVFQWIWDSQQGSWGYPCFTWLLSHVIHPMGCSSCLLSHKNPADPAAGALELPSGTALATHQTCQACAFPCSLQRMKQEVLTWRSDPHSSSKLVGLG